MAQATQPQAAAPQGASTIPFPEVPFCMDASNPAAFSPISVEALGTDRCVWCKLREDSLAAAAQGTRLRALVKFRKGAIEPPHTHSHGHDVFVVSGQKAVINHTLGERYALGPLQYLYTPAGQVHEVHYYEDTTYFFACDDVFDMHWAGDKKGIQWAEEASGR